jgi:DNA-binding transcriptional MerR regulator
MKQPDEQRWLSVAELAAKYGVLPGTARRWVRKGRVTAIRVPPVPRGRIYIADPRWTQIDAPATGDPSEWYCCLRQCEVAMLLGMTARGLRYLESAGRAHYLLIGGRKLYSVQEVRRLIAQRAIGNERRNHQETRRGMLRWAASQLRQK